MDEIKDEMNSGRMEDCVGFFLLMVMMEGRGESFDENSRRQAPANH